MEAALERDHRRALRVRARELDRVLDRLRAGVEERRLRRPGDRRPLEQPLGELDVGLVRDDREVGVREALELLLRRGDDLRVRVADVQAADAAGEVDERVAVDVGEQRAARASAATIGKVTRERRRDHALLALEDLPRARPGHLGAKLDRAGHRHAITIASDRRRSVRRDWHVSRRRRIGGVVLSDRTIERLLAEGRIEIDPYDRALLQPSSVDVRVDRYFRVFRNSRYPFIDVKQEQEDLTELVEIDGEPFILHPGEFVLGSTLERIRLPDDLVARLEGKSRVWAGSAC